jgi:nucleoside-diphosphate-sugar epimerase
MSKIFIAGATGFIGSELTEKVLEEGAEVYALCRSVTDRKPALPPEVNIVYGDLIDAHFMKMTMKKINPDIVVHLAAQSSVAYSHDHAVENVETTYIGTINLQKACEGLSNLEKFIFAGTSEEYGNQTIYPIQENAPLLPNQPYAIAKVAADEYLQYCKEATGFPAVTMRPFNTYGRKRNFTFVTESIVWQMLTKKDVVLGSPTPLRDLMYVDDHVNGYIRCIKTPFEKLANLRAINLCTGQESSIGYLANKIAELTNFKGQITWNVKNRPTEIYRLLGDWSVAKYNLNWSPKYQLEEGLKLTIKNVEEYIKCQ